MKKLFADFPDKIKTMFKARFFKAFICDTKRLLKSKVTYVFIGLIAAANIFCLIAPYIIEYDGGSDKSSYGIYNYDSPEELSSTITQLEEIYGNQQMQLDEDIRNEDITIREKENALYRLKIMKRQILVYKYLYDNKIDYGRYQDYGFIQTLIMDRNSEINLYAVMMALTFYIVSFFTVIRAATVIPSEIKDNQYKMLLTLPLKRSKYLLYKFMFIIMQSAAMLLISGLIDIAISLILYGADEILIFASAESVFGLPFFTAALFILIFHIITICVFALFSFCVSVLINSRVFSLLISLILIYVKDFAASVADFIIKGSSKYLLTSNLYPLNEYTGINNNTALISLIIIAAYLVPLTLGSLFKFNKQDLR